MNAMIGIDVSKDKLDVAWLRDSTTLKIKTVTLGNSARGFAELDLWLAKHIDLPGENIHLVMEPTSVYHETLALFLFSRGYRVSVVNPAYVRRFAESLGSVHKTDKKDSVMLARYGVAHRPEAWQPAPPEIRELKALLVRLEALDKDVQRETNRREILLAGHVSEAVRVSLDKILDELKKEQRRLENAIDKHIDQHPNLKHDRALLSSIPGIGPVASRIMLCVLREHRFGKAEECAAFLGLIPKLKQSGLMKGRTTLSKKGPASIRAKLYLPAVVAKTHNAPIRALCARMLTAGKCKMQAIGAAMRKLVHQCFGVLKHQTFYSAQAAITAA